MTTFIDILISKKRTLVTKPRLINLYNQCLTFKDQNNVSFVECGVAKGGCLALIRNFTNKNSLVYGFDSFEGMPKLTTEDQNQARAKQWVGKTMASLKDAQETMQIMKVDITNLHIIKGFFENTIPIHKQNLQNIAILRIDADWYKATKYVLDELYDQVIPGGIIIIDDYDAYIGCKTAVDEFRSKRNITSPLIKTQEKIKGLKEGTERWWRKE